MTRPLGEDAQYFSNGTIEAYPLAWPIGQPRTPASQRKSGAAFIRQLGHCRDLLLHELTLLGARDIVISSNLPVRRDGLPYADSREPDDPGVAVYFDRVVSGKRRPFVIACDTYAKVAGNLRALGLTVQALRAIERHGSSALLEQAFQGFAALPQSTSGKPWWEVLGTYVGAPLDEVKRAYTELVAIHHPDKGGDHERMAEINRAWEEAKASGGGA